MRITVSLPIPGFGGGSNFCSAGSTLILPFVTASCAAVDAAAAVAQAYHVYYQKVRQGSSYSMDHSAVVYLMDPLGRFVRPLDVGVAPPRIAGQIRDAMGGA